jgi:aerobic carbon-monoxide dehydrogenase medium subunit
VLDARLEVCAPDDTTREIPVERYAASPGAPDGLLTALFVPVAPARSGSAYLKHGRVAQDRATVGVAAWLVRGTDGRCAAVRLAVGGLEAAPVVRASAIEAEASGAVIDDALLGRLARLAATTLPTQDDELASAEYRRQLLSVYLPRALAAAWVRSAENAA